MMSTSALPPLRQELQLHPGPVLNDGAPSWVLYDPPRNRFFRIGWAEFELLSRWGLGPADRVLEAVNRDTALNLEPRHLESVVEFLMLHQLIRGGGPRYMDWLAGLAERNRPRPLHWLLHHYLFFRIPLVRPDRFLNATWPLVRPLFSRNFLLLLLGLFGLGAFLVSRQWDAFLQTFLHFHSLEGLILFGIALSLAKVAHELGHAYAAKRYGLAVPTMGVAFLVMWPVLYTESSEAWKLAQRRPRLLIAAAGMATELALAVAATLLWSFLPDGPLRSAVFLLATSTWLVTLLINLNPFMRFDGYYLLSDLLDVANLQERAFALARWRLRELLFDLGQAPPEVFPPRLRRILIAYAWGTWIYRFFLFLGIALLVYFFFFKAAGILLMLTEILWFIALPVKNELSEWWRLRGMMRWNARSLISLGALLALAALLVTPWQGHLALPARLEHAAHARIYPPTSGRLAQIQVQRGQAVAAGDPLFRLENPDLEHRLAQARLETAEFRLDLEGKSAGDVYLEDQAILRRRLAEAKSRAEGLEKELQRLSIRAPQAGTVRFLNPELRPGRWVNEGLLLAHLVAPEGLTIQAYAEESQIGRIAPDAKGRFFSENPDTPPLDLRIQAIDRTPTRTLERPDLQSRYGGPLAVREIAPGRSVTEKSLFRIQLVPLLERGADYPSIQRGTVRLEAERESLLIAGWRRVSAVLIRESGF